MRFVLAPDSFKESMTAPQVVAAMERGIRAVFPDAVCVGAPMADGGEGTTDALVSAMGGEHVETTVLDGLGRPIQTRYGHVPAEKLAIIEIAAAAGIDLIAAPERDPRVATTYGVGQLITHALDRGAQHFVIGLGGSVTNDGGAGMLQALGARLLDDDGHDLPSGGAALARLRTLNLSEFDHRLAAATFEIASDVTNPLLGPTGASAVFGPQKGADPATVRELDDALGVYARVLTATTGRDVGATPGAGAAGGLGVAFLACFPAQMHRGVDVVMRAAHLDDLMVGADIVFTGEGSIDSQTANGKTPFGVAQAAQRHRIPVVAFAGHIGAGAEILYTHGFTALVPIVQGVSDLATALTDGPANLERAVATTCRVMTLKPARVP